MDIAKARRTEFVETVMKEVGLSLGVADDLEKSLRIGRCLLLLKVTILCRKLVWCVSWLIYFSYFIVIII